MFNGQNTFKGVFSMIYNGFREVVFPWIGNLFANFILLKKCTIIPLGLYWKIVLSFSWPRYASIFLQRGPRRIGSVYKKAIYKQYTDASYSQEIPKPTWLGYLGPILRAEVHDVIIVHLKNFASRRYSMHPHGVFYAKDSEGKTYFSLVHFFYISNILLLLVLTSSCLH